MTEEIIIDGVNVWSCKHYDLENNYCDQSYLGEGGLLKNTKNPKRCECSPNCYYKQLKRLEQENKALKDNINHLQAIIDDGLAENKRFREENKELKSQRDEARIAYNDLILDIVSDIPFEGEIGGERFISIKDRLYQMQKALASLEEIREIVNQSCDNCKYNKDDITCSIGDCGEGKLKIIENKINEVLGNEV